MIFGGGGEKKRKVKPFLRVEIRKMFLFFLQRILKGMISATVKYPLQKIRILKYGSENVSLQFLQNISASPLEIMRVITKVMNT